MALNPNDQSYFTLLKQGDQAAFDRLFRKYYTHLCRFALTLSGNETLAEEAVQNVFVRLWEKRKRVDQPTHVKGYLFRAVYNESLWLIKKHKSQQALEAQYALHPPEELSTSDHHQWETLRPFIQIAIENLPDKCRHIFLMRRQEGLTNVEIAEYLGVSVKTVENQMTIAIRKLRDELHPHIHHLPLVLFFANL